MRANFYLFVVLTFFTSIEGIIAQTCNCTEFIYVNEVNSSFTGGQTHKFEINSSNGNVTEIGNPWHANPALPFPHGLGTDRNGFLYIGSSAFDPNTIRRLDCAGNLFPTLAQDPVNGFNTGDSGYGLTNVTSFDGFIYSNGGGNVINKWNPCTGARVGFIRLTGAVEDWGLFIDTNGKFYVTDKSGKIYVFTPNNTDFTSNTSFNASLDLAANTNYQGLTPAYSGTGLQGVTTDNIGNIYIVEGNRDNLNTPSRLLKFDASLNLLGAGPIDANGTDGAGWSQMTGIVYSKSANKLYTTSLQPNQDCVYRWNTDLTPNGAVVGPSPGAQFAKGIAILSECCPQSETIQKSVCGVLPGDRTSLSELLTCDGIICEGMWTPGGSNTGLTYNNCDITATVGSLPACGSFTISNTTLTNRNCPDFTVTMNVSYLANVNAQVIGGGQTICAGIDPPAFSITTAASSTPPGETITYQWQSSTTSATTGFNNISGAMSATYDPGPITQTTYFRVIASVAGCVDGACRDTSNVVVLTLQTVGCTPPCLIPVPVNNICSENIFTNPTLENSTTNVFNDEVAGVSASFLGLNDLQATGNTAAPIGWSNPTANGPINKTDYTGIFYLNDNGNKMVWMRNNAAASPAQCLSPIDYERYPLKECTRYLFRASVAGWSPSSIVTSSNGITSMFLEYWIGPPNYAPGDSKQFSIPTTSDCNNIVWQEIEFEFITGGSDPNNTINHALLVSLRDNQRDGLLVDNIQLCEMESCSNCNLAVTCNPLPQTSCTPPNGSATTTVTGAQGNITYLWSSGETTSSISGKVAGTYTVTVTDNILPGCTATCQAIIGSTTTLPTAQCDPMPNTNCASPNGSAIVTTNANQILWSTGATTATITGLSNATYTVTVTNTTTGCTNTCQAVVGSTTTLPTAQCDPMPNTNCAIPNGSATVTTNANQILWSTGATTATITGLSNATYTVTVTNTTTGCTNTCQAVVGSTTTVPTAQCDPMPNTNCATPNGSATVTTNANQILWSTGANTTSINGLAAGTYTVTVTNTTTGCTNTCQAVVGSTTTLPTAQCDPMPNTNCSTPNGSATVSTNANQILWNTGANTTSINGLAAGTYTVTVTNTTTGCTNTCQAVVANSTVSPTCTIAINNQPSCANLTGGSITVTPSPIGTYTYAWSDNGAATATRTGLTGGTYTVTVTNTTTNCTGVCNVTLDTPTNCCNIQAIVPQNLECLDNGTPAKITDNRIRFSAQVTNTNTSLTGYNVTINGGTTIAPNTNVPYGVTQFTLGPGTAGGGATFTITVTDSATPGCSQTFQVTDPGNCTPGTPECPPMKCGTATIQVNGN